MSKISVTVEVQKDTYEVGVLVGNVIKALKDKKPIATIAVEELAALSAAVEGIQNVPAEYGEDKAAFIRAVTIPISDAIGSLLTPSSA